MSCEDDQSDQLLQSSEDNGDTASPEKLLPHFPTIVTNLPNGNSTIALLKPSISLSTTSPFKSSLTSLPTSTEIIPSPPLTSTPIPPSNKPLSSTTSSSSSSSSSGTESLDGGWGWVVVFASFMAHVIADGCCYSAGIFLVEWLEVFEETKAHTSWVPALFVSMHAIFGPVSSICTNKFGCRWTTVVGGVVASLGCILSTFATSVNQLCFTFGLISGFGLSLVYVPAVVVVAFYFEKKRAFATGIAVAGSGLGGFVFPVMVELLIEWYSWRGATLIMGGVMLNIVLCGALFRPLISFKEQRKHKRYLRSLHRFSRTSSCRESRQGFDQNAVCDHRPGEEIDCVFCQQNRADTPPVTRSLQEIPTFLDFDSVFKQYSEFNVDTRKNSSSASHVIHVHPSNTSSTPANRNFKSILSKRRAAKKHPKVKSKKAHFPDHIVPKFPRDAYFRGSLWKTGFLHDQSASCPDVFVRSKKKRRSLREKVRLFGVALKDMLDFSVFRSPVFVCFCCHSLLLYVSYDMPYMYLPDLAQQLGIPSIHSSYLLSICGIASAFGQIAIGYVGDKPKVDSRYLYIAMMVVAGVSTMLIPLLSQYSSFIIFCIVFGFTISANYCLTTIIIVDLLGMEQLTNAYGFVTLSEGVANLVGVPLGGWLTDSTGSYDLAFYLSGTGVVLSGLVLCLMPCLKRLDPLVKKKQEKEMAGQEEDGGEDQVFSEEQGDNNNQMNSHNNHEISNGDCDKVGCKRGSIRFKGRNNLIE